MATRENLAQLDRIIAAVESTEEGLAYGTLYDRVEGCHCALGQFAKTLTTYRPGDFNVAEDYRTRLAQALSGYGLSPTVEHVVMVTNDDLPTAMCKEAPQNRKTRALARLKEIREEWANAIKTDGRYRTEDPGNAGERG